jgi:hypothetical protein
MMTAQSGGKMTDLGVDGSQLCRVWNLEAGPEARLHHVVNNLWLNRVRLICSNHEQGRVHRELKV